MKLILDLHTHSGYAGGAGEKDLVQAAYGASLKGINVLGTGDCLHKKWLNHLKENLQQSERGLLSLKRDAINRASTKSSNIVKFLLQTEIIFTAPQVNNPKRKQTWHAVIFFPDYATVEQVIELFEKWGVNNSIGRPFVTCGTLPELREKISAILETNPLVEMVFAHILTNFGFFGYKSQNIFFEDTLGKELNSRIKLIETGLSAEPQMLKRLPELEDKVWVSFSDSHSGQLHRVGRELTVVETEKEDYASIITALGEGNILETVEFKPEEGRYFLTGHSSTKQGHKKDENVRLRPHETPKNKRCPVCNKPLTIGVLERAQELEKLQHGSLAPLKLSKGKKVVDEKNPIKKYPRNYRYLVPLIQLIPGGKQETYEKLVAPFSNEYNLWSAKEAEIKQSCQNWVQNVVLEKVLKVRRGEFDFDPPGFDGVYGKLKI